jgi:hypothetical protein
MRASFLISVLISLCLFNSCSKKESKENDPIPQPQTQPDSILYTECDSSISVYTVLFYTPSLVPPNVADCADLPNTSDTSAYLVIDINKDSVPDFIFEGSDTVTYGQCGSHCACPFYKLKMRALNPGDSISINFTGLYRVPFAYDTTSSIQNTATWAAMATLNDITYLWGAIFFSETYVGVKMNNNFGWIHIKPRTGNGVYITDYAINLTVNNSIIAGQKH